MTDAKKFRIKGYFRQKGSKSTFTKEVSATSEERAQDRILSKVGSDHHLKRNRVILESTEEVNE